MPISLVPKVVKLFIWNLNFSVLDVEVNSKKSVITAKYFGNIFFEIDAWRG